MNDFKLGDKIAASNKSTKDSSNKQSPTLTYMKDNRGTFSFVLVMFLATVAVMVHQFNNPRVCTSTATVKDIIAINEDYAQLRLNNEKVINYQISNEKVITTPTLGADGNMSYSSETIKEYKTNLHIGKEICLAYSR